MRGVNTTYVRLLDQEVVVAIACNYEPKQRPDFFAGDLIDALMK